MRIFFNADISPASIAHIYFAPDAKLMDGGRSFVSSSNSRELDTPFLPSKQLLPGSYIVRWTALSSVDGQATHGVIGFNIGYSSLGVPGNVILGPGTSNILPQLDMQGILTVAWDWLVMAALMLWLGILVAEGLFLTSGREEHEPLSLTLRKHSLPLQRLSLLALLFGEIINLVLRATNFNQLQGNSGIHLGTVMQVLVETSYGYFWLARIILIVIALGFLWWTTREQPAIANANLSGRAARTAGTGKFSRLRQQAAVEESTPASMELPSLAPASNVNTPLPDKTNGDVVVPLVGTRNTANTPLADTRDAGNASLAHPSNDGTRAIPRWQTSIWLTLAGLILLTLALSGEAASQAQPQTSTIVLNWIFLAAQGIGLGSVAYLAFVLLPLGSIGEPDHYAESLVTLMQRYRPVLIGAIALAFLTGLLLAETALTSTQQLLTDPYGRALLVSLASAIVMLILMGYALYYLFPKMARQSALLPVVNAELPARRVRRTSLERTRHNLQHTLTIVACLGALLLLCAALMSFFAPPIIFPHVHYSQNSGSPVGPPTTQTRTVGNLTITLQVTPARVDETNTVTVTLKDSSGSPVTDAQVQLSINMQIMDMGTTSKSIVGGKPAYTATFAGGEGFDMQGIWDIFVRIQRPGQQPVQAQFQIMVS
jgi:putative copper export protein